MKKTLLTVSLIAGLAACVQAQGTLGPDGTESSANGQYGSFQIDNEYNTGAGGLAASTEGLVYINGSILTSGQDVNVDVYNGGTLIVSLIGGQASGDAVAIGGNGSFTDNSEQTYFDTAVVGGGTATLTLDFWTDFGTGASITSYASAVGVVPTATVTFSQALGDASGPTPSVASTFTSMPAVNLTVPEPTTLAFAGLGGLSVLLFRRRK